MYVYMYLPGLYSLEAMMLSNIPPVLPILKQPGLIPPTYTHNNNNNNNNKINNI